MRRIFIYLTTLLAVAISLSACESDTELIEPVTKPSVEDCGDGCYFSKFTLPALWDLGEGVIHGDVIDIKLELLPLRLRLKEYNFDGLLTAGEEHAIGFTIGGDTGEDLPSDSYLLRAYKVSDGERFLHEFVILVKERKVIDFKVVPLYSSKLNTSADVAPEEEIDNFTIEDEDDFLDFLDLIDEDPSKGRGKTFTQRRDLTLNSNMGSTTIDEGWYNYDFAGTYNGLNHTITGFAYSGNIGDENCCDVGLFRKLLNGAAIKNLQLMTGGISGVHNRCGILAGSVAEDAEVSISNCTLYGTISDVLNMMGGLFGYAKNAIINIENIKLGLNILCKPDKDFGDSGIYCGGLIGYADSSKITIDGCEVYLDNMKVEGYKYVGGLIGSTVYCDVAIDNVDLERSTTKNLQVVSGYYDVGGLIGYVGQKPNGGFHIKNTTIAFPIGGYSSVGGMIGSWFGYSPKGSTIEPLFEDVYISSYLTGSVNIGGFFGYAYSSTNTVTNFVWRGKCYFGSIDNNLTEILGETNVGGLFGKLSYGVIFDLSNVDLKVAAVIEATTECAGGFVGYAEDLRLKLYKSFSTATSKVIAPKSAGGVVGYMNGGIIEGNTPIYDFKSMGGETIPSLKSIRDDGFDVTIKVECGSATDVGGVAGRINSDSTIKNISVSNEVTGGSHVGGIVGFAIGKYVYIQGAYTSTTGFTSGSGIEIGGIIGRAESSILVENCINYSRIDSGSEVGGIVGYALYSDRDMPYIQYCVNAGTINGSNVVGGVVGLARVDLGDYNSGVMIEHCANVGDVIGTTSSSYSGSTKAIGGILGNSDKPAMQVSNCANFGDVIANGSFYGAGGIVGKIGVDPGGAWEEYNYRVQRCANHGNLSGDASGCNWGGIVGYMEEGTFTSGEHALVGGCYNKGDINASISGNNGLGGIAGYLDSYAELRRNINFKYLTSYKGGNTGRIWGSSKSSVHTTDYNYYRDDSDNSHYAFTESEMSNPNTFSNLRINEDDSFWVMHDGDPHPQINGCLFQNATYSAE